MFHAWNTFIDKEEDFTWEYFLSSPLWMNKTIKIENKPVFYEDWFRKGICFVNDIFDIYVTEYGTALTTILPILFLYLNTVTVTAGTFEP